MDEIFAKIAQETTTFNLGDEEKWRTLYEPFYKPPPPTVTVIRDERYGPAERNLLDVFVPVPTSPSPEEEEKEPTRPVLMFVHGGGFFSGGKQWSEKVYSNIGYFFAQHGIITVVANHQLVPHVQYPGGAQDMQLAREWIYNNIASPRYGRGAPGKVVLLGSSSGGAHIAMNLYSPAAAADPNIPVFPPVAGIIYLSVPFWYDRRKPVRQRTIRSYYGSDDEEVWGPKSGLGLFKALPDGSPLLDSQKIPIYLGTVEWEVPETADAMVKFLDAYRARSRPSNTLPVFHVLKKHNHLSNVLSIGTEDTVQGRMLVDFVYSCVGGERERKREGRL
ncbi:Alpha/Beta hydrolase protein [Aspergillus cavernicola]|uniref:Alpha/Beta hydrolase protein n=1 Tax=Aspergillus cavernicola TaxID=176166 RepID=A0ABR4IDY4_9EURO